MKTSIFILIFVFLLSISIVMSQAYAATSKDPYDIQRNRFIIKPTICVVEPSNDYLPNSKIKLIMEESKKGIFEWITLIQEKTDNKDKWAINYVEISNNDKKSFDFSSCNAIVNFKNEVGVPIHSLGTHQYLDGTSYVTVFYKTNECKQYTKGSCKAYDQDLKIIIGSTIKHEFGHVLGLGHYESNKLKNKEWFENPQTAPSIMLEYSKGTQHESVSSSDINKVIEIYKNSGFTNQHMPKIRNTLLIALTHMTPTELFVSDSTIKASKELSIITISGKFEKTNGLLDTVDLTILRPDSKLEKTKIPLDRNGFFEYEYEIHSKLPKGIYYVQVQYGKNITEKNAFEIN